MGRHRRRTTGMNDGDKLRFASAIAQLIAAAVRVALAFWPGGPFHPHC